MLNTKIKLVCDSCGKEKTISNLGYYGVDFKTDKSDSMVIRPVKIGNGKIELMAEVESNIDLGDVEKLIEFVGWYYDRKDNRFYCDECKPNNSESGYITYACSYCSKELRYRETLIGEGFIDFTGWYAYDRGTQYLCPTCYRIMLDKRIRDLGGIYNFDNLVVQFLTDKPYLVLLNVLDDVYNKVKQVCGDKLADKLEAYVYSDIDGTDSLVIEVRTNSSSEQKLSTEEEIMNWFIWYDTIIRFDISILVI